VDRARKILETLKAEGAPEPIVTKIDDEEDDQITMLDLRSQQVCQVLESINVETLTPIEAMNELYKLKKMLD
jgi:DNA mismatch repair protein MutS